MTFGQYLQNMGLLLAQWLPIAFLFYLAVRKGYLDGARDAFRMRVRPLGDNDTSMRAPPLRQADVDARAAS